MISTEPVKDKTGKQVGERILLGRSGKDYQVVVWTNGDLLFHIMSFAKDAEQFEKNLPPLK